jgi:hypothetical protein
MTDDDFLYDVQLWQENDVWRVLAYSDNILSLAEWLELNVPNNYSWVPGRTQISGRYLVSLRLLNDKAAVLFRLRFSR